MSKTLIFKQNNKYGLRSLIGTVILEAEYEKLKYLTQERYAAKKDGLWAILDSEGNFLSDYIYKEVSNFRNDRAIVQSDSPFVSRTLIDLSAKEVEMDYKEDIIESNKRYQNIFPTLNGERYIANNGFTYRLIDNNGKFINGGETYKTLKPINENLFLAKKFGRQAIINEKHEVLFEVPEKFDEIYYQMANGMYQVTTSSNLSGYLDAQGNEVIPAIYYVGYEFSKDADLAFVMIDDEKGGYINSKNEFIIEPIYEYGTVFSYGRAGVLKDNVWFFIDEKGNKISDDFAKISEFINGFAHVKLLDGNNVIVNSSGEVIISYPEHVKISYFVNGLATITEEKKVGLINSNGEILIEPKYEEITISEYHNIHRFKENGLYGYIRSDGKKAVKPSFTKAENFGKNGSTFVEKEGISFLIQDFGKKILEANKEDNSELSPTEFGDSDVACVKFASDAYAFLDKEGGIVGSVYEYATPFYNGQACVTLPAKHEIIDKDGKLVDTTDVSLTLEYGEIILESKE